MCVGGGAGVHAGGGATVGADGCETIQENAQVWSPPAHYLVYLARVYSMLEAVH